MKKISKLETVPTIVATVTFNSIFTGENISRTFEVTKQDINDVEWFGGNCGDNFFDDEFETDEDRFIQRLEDYLHGCLWANDVDGSPMEEHLNYSLKPDGYEFHPDGLDYDDRIEFSYSLGKYRVEDFYPK